MVAHESYFPVGMSNLKNIDTAIVKPTTAAVDKFTVALTGYLAGLGLPREGVLVVPAERQRVLSNLPDLVDDLDADQRAEALYISKFIAACGAGLFDAALNFIWDEVVVRLRQRVASFDLAYFYDTAVPASERATFSDEGDLPLLSDALLIRGALNCGMLTDIGYRHLDYIREMRNWASAAHPNQAQLTGFQIIAWFETCLKEVILREPEGAVLEVGRLLANLRQHALDATAIAPVIASVKRLPVDLASALLRSVAGMYCDPRVDVRVRDNIRLVAKDVWECANETSRGEVGLRYATYSANADLDRKNLAHEFLDHVGGLTYLPSADAALEISNRITRLENAQDAMNNFYNEPPIARELRKYIPDTGKIPEQINEEYVRVLIRCRVGRRSGAAGSAVPVYDELIDLFGEAQIKAFITTSGRSELAGRLDDVGCANRFRAIVARLAPKVVSQPLKRVFAAINSATPQQLPVLWRDTTFQRLVAAI